MKVNRLGRNPGQDPKNKTTSCGTKNNVCNASIPPNARDRFRIHPFDKGVAREFLVHSPIDLIRRQREAATDKRASRCGRGYFCGYSDSELREGSLIMLHQKCRLAVAARSAPTRSVGRPSRPARAATQIQSGEDDGGDLALIVQLRVGRS